MGDKLVIGPVDKGLVTNRTAFNIDNDAFPVLVNAYQWRGRVKRKRGTRKVTRLQRFFNSSSTVYSAISTITLDGSGNGNIITGFSLPTTISIVPGSVTITAPGPTLFTDPLMNGTLSPSGIINYVTGAILIAAEAGQAISVIFTYYPQLPVMGLEDFYADSSGFPNLIALDTTYSYNIVTNFPNNTYDVTFYKYLASGTYAGYTQKAQVTPFTWNGLSYQQFWSVNYQNAMWVTNGVQVPFNISNIGMQYKAIITVTVLTPTTASLQITGHGLVVGDFVFINEVLTTTGINFQTGYVTTVTNANNVIVTFPNATLATNGTAGIAQYLTSTAIPGVDCIRWYDGDPTNGSIITPIFNTFKGWVNFMPPLSEFAATIADLPRAQYYLVGAKIIATFKDRLVFLGPVVQSSTGGVPIYLEDTIVYSQNGTPFYTASFTGDPSLSTTVFNPILVPTMQTATPNAYWSDQTGFGGFKSTGVDQPITTVSSNKDALIGGFTNFQTRIVYTGNDIDPFNFYVINSELGSGSTFSAINMDAGVISRGGRGYIITSQTSCERIDIPIPDQVFEISLLNNGSERFTATRDFINEWIYFTYPSSQTLETSVYPTQTLQWNYRDNSWAIFNEAYTTYGTLRQKTGPTWFTIGLDFPTWGVWDDPWGAGITSPLQPSIIAGNHQGFVIEKGVGTGESTSLYITSFSGSQITSPSHSLTNGDYIVISGALGTVAADVNGKIFQVTLVAVNTFNVIPDLPMGLTYLGLGVITKMYVPLIQTKQFPVAWQFARKTRLGAQQYLLTNSNTNTSQVTLEIFLSQDGANPYNVGNVIPAPGSQNNALIYSTVLYTCPESTNLGLTAANTNLQMPSALNQSQIWHRMNTSLLGDTVQLGITLSNAQMIDTTFSSQFAEIELHSIILDVSPSSLLA